jgi:hypothetical protein
LEFQSGSFAKITAAFFRVSEAEIQAFFVPALVVAKRRAVRSAAMRMRPD